jgi:hypothetical protein
MGEKAKEEAAAPDEKPTCPSCGKNVKARWKTCPYCGATI